MINTNTNTQNMIFLNGAYNPGLSKVYATRENVKYPGNNLRIHGFNAIKDVLNEYDIKNSDYNYLAVELFTKVEGKPGALVTQFKEYPENYETTDCTYTAIYKIV